MLDLKSLEPKIELFHPLLRHYGPESAILYGYLKHLIIEKDLHIKLWEGTPYYDVHTTRNDIKDATGLSFGKQLDAELDLTFANLAISFEKDGNVGYDLYPQNEESLRRALLAKKLKWSIQ